MAKEGFGAKIIRKQKEEMVQCSQRLARQGLLSGYEGNISVRMGKEHMLITRSMSDKMALTTDDILLCHLNGDLVERPVIPGARISSEFRLHQRVYQGSPESWAMVHSHPPYAIMAGLDPNIWQRPRLAEPWIYFGEIPTAPFAMPGSEEMADSIASFLPHSRAILLQGHGAIIHSDELLPACVFTEMLEKTCRIQVMTRQNADLFQLKDDQLKELRQLHQQLLGS